MNDVEFEIRKLSSSTEIDCETTKGFYHLGALTFQMIKASCFSLGLI